MWIFEIISLCLVLVVTLASGFYPFFKKTKIEKKEVDFPVAESLAAGVFLGAGLIHMLAQSSSVFYRFNWHYPIAFVLAGSTFLFLLWLEHIGRELSQRKDGSHNAFAVLAVVMLSVHAFLMGAALGLSNSFSIGILILLAILAHKWAESLALSIEINKSHFSRRFNLILFLIFALMTPIGILFGASATTFLHQYTLLEPIFSALAAGTFLYLGTLHGLEKATLIKRCCDLKRFYFVILGFSVMAVVAIWI